MIDPKENLYRFGVLVGNHVEDRFGKILAQSARSQLNQASAYQTFHNLNSTSYYADPSLSVLKTGLSEGRTHPAGLERHLFIGHGPDQDHFEGREFKTSYELAYADRVQAHKTVDPHFTLPPPAAKPGPVPYDQNPHSTRRLKPYKDFTKQCDATFNKIDLRR
mmetsp:Transcript_32792/g.57083  ORF Transcript_32792/g.57083 Transcript_32792/m.57083 type:complete len:163 (-) Transcript_32792:2314-2802(-)